MIDVGHKFKNLSEAVNQGPEGSYSVDGTYLGPTGSAPASEPYAVKPIRGKLKISGAFQFRDKDGNVISTMEIIDGEIPLNRFTQDEQQQLIKEYGNGTDNR